MQNLNKDILIQNIKQLMKEHDVTQPKLAEDLHIGQPSISKCLSGKQSISIDLIYSIAKYFDVSIDDLCSPTKTKNEPTNDEFPVPPPPVNQFQEICTALSTIFKYATLKTTDIDHRETVYAEIIDNGYETGEYYRKKDFLGAGDPVNKYTAIFFSNYHELECNFDTQEDADEYLSELRYCGNILERNVKINKFLKQLTDLHNIYMNGSLTQESYFHSIDSNLAKIIDL